MKNTNIRILGISVVSTCFWAAAFAESPTLAKAPAVENLPAGAIVKLGALPTDPPQWVNLSPSGDRILMLTRKGSRWTVYENGKAGELYDQVPLEIGSDIPFPPAFTADGNTSLHLAVRDRKVHLVANGKPGDALDEILGAWIAPMGGGHAIIGMKTGKPFFYRDGAKLEIPGLAERLGLPNHRQAGRYSPDGRRFLYLLETPDRHVRRWVLENQLLPPFSSYEEEGWVFGPGDSYAYAVGEGVGDKAARRAYFNGRKQPELGEPGFPIISADGKHVAYRIGRPPTKEEIDIMLPRAEGETGKKYQQMRKLGIGYPGVVSRLVRNGVELPITTEPVSAVVDFVIGPAGQIAAAYTTSWEDVDEGGRPRGVPKGIKVWIDGKSSLQYDAWHGSHFSPDGSLVVSFVAKDQQYYVLVNDDELGPYTKVDPKGLHFFPEGGRYHFPAQLANGTNALIENGKPSPHRFDGGLARSRDGKRTAYISYRGADPKYPDAIYCNLVVDEKVHEIPGTIRDILFSPDGSRIACLFQPPPADGSNSPGLAWVDGRVIPPMVKQEDAHSLEFSPDGKHFAYTATVDVPEHSKRNQASGYSMNVRVIDERPGPLLYLDYKAPAISEQHGNIIVTRHYPTSFGTDGTVSYFARDEESLLRISLSGENLAALPDLEKRAGLHADASKSEAERMNKKKKDAADAEPFQVPHVFEWPYLEQTCVLVEGNDGKLYGSAFVGRFKTGGLFRCNGDGSEMKVLHEFTGEGGEGLAIRSIIKTIDGTLYMALGPNMHVSEQPKWKAAIFRLDPGTDKPVPVYLAPAEVDRKTVHFDVLEYPLFTQVTSDHLIYGGMAGPTLMSLGFRLVTKPQPGLEIVSNNTDYIWSFSKNGVNLIATPGTDSNDNKNKVGLLPIEAGGRLYSITGGGRGHAGMIVSTARDGTDIRTEYEFTLESPEGGKPSPLLQAGPDGSVFGFTTEGGSREDWQNRGAVFRYNPADKSCVPVVLADHYHGIGWPVCFGRDGRMYFTAGGELHGISAAEAASGKPFGFPDQNKKVKANETSARFPEKLHTFTAFQNKKIEEYGVTSFGILTMVSLADGSFAGIGATGGLSNPPFLFTVRPKK